MNAIEPDELESMTPSSASSQSNIFSDRTILSSQLSYDQASKQVGNFSTASSIRRRHRSEIHPSNNAMNNVTPLFPDEDYFTKRRSTVESTIRSPVATSTTKAPSNANASGPDLLTNDSNADSRYCRCWCQNWAEILIRRSTGNTRWITRVENHLGDCPYWTFSEDADDSLAEIFSNADPSINLALKMQKEADKELDDKIDQFEPPFNADNKEAIITSDGSSLKSAQEKALSQSQPAIEEVNQQQRVSTAVARASSFGTSRRTMQSNIPEQQQQQQTSPRQIPEMQTLNQAKHKVLERFQRRLEKDYSVDQDDPPSVLPASQRSQMAPSPVNSSASSDMTVTSPDRNSVNFRDRSSTISVMTPVQKSASSTGVHQSPLYDSSKSSSTLNMSSSRPSISSGALSPQAVFLQLYYNSSFKDVTELSMSERPILLDKNDALVRSISCFDRITPYETHKVAVLYIGPGQVKSKIDILSNQMGSLRYTNFIQKLGHTVNLEDVDPNVCFLGGLDKNEDGPYAISWGDHLVQAIFHVGTLMPLKDPNCNSKMRHIGNDFVAIIYNNSGEKFDILTVKVILLT